MGISAPVRPAPHAPPGATPGSGPRVGRRGRAATPGAAAPREGTAAGGRQVIRAPMPGRVVRILVGLGEPVEAGQGVIVIEAMKMENELRARAPGEVREILVREGDTVEGNADLVVIE
ncbi:MAG: acetyl-CoA carboxylase biotin carboxyl carrier protein subunit [Deltaproteobacteria bacterium]|nr:acetyl-CoA carboxylase biotin carboxyl carrier protein subunit [Deltaproteobacteria bacterium]